MRKKNDGYILVYVMFVLVFLCLAAVAVCSSALDNLTAQNDAADRMEQRLTADSRVEKFMATVSKGGTVTGSGTLPDAKDSFVNIMKANASGMSIKGEVAWSGSGDLYDCAVTLQTEKGSVRVDATVDFLVTIACWEEKNVNYDAENPANGPEYYDYWEISNVTSKYLSYATEYVNSEGGETE